MVMLKGVWGTQVVRQILEVEVMSVKNCKLTSIVVASTKMISIIYLTIMVVHVCP